MNAMVYILVMVFNIEDVPKIESHKWSIKITGLVEDPLKLSLKQLKGNFSATNVDSNILCLRGATIKGKWSGVKAYNLLNKAKSRSEANWVLIKAHSNFYEPIKLSDFIEDGVIVAYYLNNKPIPVEQGGPIRLIVLNKYAYKSVKWLKELELLKNKPQGFWEKKGFPYKDE